MDGDTSRVGADAFVARVQEFLADLPDLPGLPDLGLTRASDEQVRAVWQAKEQLARALARVDHAVVAELGIRHGPRSVPALAVQLLRISPVEARRRVRDAADLGPRVTVTGEPLPAVFPTVAAAQAEGIVSVEHARVITSGIESLSPDVQTEHGEWCEEFLVEHARRFDPATLRKLTTAISERLDQDSIEQLHDKLERERYLTVQHHDNGSISLKAKLTPEVAARLTPLLRAFGQPAHGHGLPDDRSAGQRNHDAFADIVNLAARSGEVPTVGGTPSTLILIAEQRDFTTGTGLAYTGDGDPIPLNRAKQWITGATTITTVHPSPDGNPTVDTRRLCTPNQHTALIARDRGCCFPGCHRPPQHTEAHHIIPWADGGPTTVDNLALLCSHHHRNHQADGWQLIMQDHHPWWRPPPWLDPQQTLIRNDLHCPSGSHGWRGVVRLDR